MLKHRAVRVLIPALAGALLLAAPVWAMMASLSLGDLAGQATDVVVGRVSAVQSKWTSDRSLIVTQAVVEVDQSLKGGLGRDSILVEYIGGEVDGVGLRASGMVSLSANEQVVLFLKGVEARASAASSLAAMVTAGQDDGITSYGVVGGAQGKYLLQSGMASKGGYLTSSGVASSVSMSQDDLITLIKEAVGDAGAK